MIRGVGRFVALVLVSGALPFSHPGSRRRRPFPNSQSPRPTATPKASRQGRMARFGSRKTT
jgi:hypothetical protein